MHAWVFGIIFLLLLPTLIPTLFATALCFLITQEYWFQEHAFSLTAASF